MADDKILIAGSGAVGAVYADHLERAGCTVAFLIRDPASPNAAMPRQLHRFRPARRTVSVTQNVTCVTRAHGDWDQVWLCLPSTALETDWVAERLAELPSGTPVVSWTPDVRDRGRLASLYDGPILQGVIGFLSFQSPLPGTEMTQQGFGYVLLPAASAVLEDVPQGERAAAWLRDGGLPARTHSDLAWLAACGAAVMICTVAALELNGWSLVRLRRSDDLALAHRAAVEAIRASASAAGRQPGLAIRLPYRTMLRAFLTVAPLVSPLPLEAYLRFHFSKVSPQTRLMLDSWLAIARRQDQQAPTLEMLRRRLEG